jgi:hypothetical protein
MRRFLAWLACGAGAVFVFRWRLRRRRPEPAPDPAEELKRKLDESRAAEPDPAPPPAAPEQPETGVDERRRAVHERGRAAIDEMRDRGQTPSD